MGLFGFLKWSPDLPPGHKYPVGTRVVLVDAPFWKQNRHHIGFITSVEEHLSHEQFRAKFPPWTTFPDGLPNDPCYAVIGRNGVKLYVWESALRPIDDDEDKSGLTDERPNDLTTWNKVPYFKPSKETT